MDAQIELMDALVQQHGWVAKETEYGILLTKDDQFWLIFGRHDAKGLCTIMVADLCKHLPALNSSNALIYQGTIPNPTKFEILWSLLTNDRRLVNYDMYGDARITEQNPNNGEGVQSTEGSTGNGPVSNAG